MWSHLYLGVTMIYTSLDSGKTNRKTFFFIPWLPQSHTKLTAIWIAMAETDCQIPDKGDTGGDIKINWLLPAYSHQERDQFMTMLLPIMLTL